MIGQQLAVAHSVAGRRRKSLSGRRRHRHVRRRIAELRHTPAPAPNRPAGSSPRPRSISIRSVSPQSVRSCGVSVLRASVHRRKRRDDQRQRRGHLLFRAAVVPTLVFIDSESLPTGMLMPSCGHSSMPTARTVSNSAASSPGWPAAAIQLADSLTSPSFAIARRGDIGDRLADRHAPRGRGIDQRQRRAFAHGHRLAAMSR